MKNRNRRWISWGLVMSCLGISGSAFSGDLKTPFALESTATLPAGVRNPRFINVVTSVGSKFSGDGSIEPLGQALNKGITWGDVLEAQEDNGKRASVSGLLEKNGIDQSGGPGSSSGEVNTFANVKVVALAFGVNERLTLAGVLPIVKVDVSASTGFVANADGNAFVNGAAADSSPLTAYEAQAKLVDPINQKLIRLGYEPIAPSDTVSGVGDAQLIAKYRLRSDDVSSVAIKAALVFPTGIAPNPDKVIDVPTGDGRYAVGLSAIYDRKLPLDIRWNSYSTYNALLPRKIVKRIPTSVRDTLSANKEELSEGLRSQVLMGTGLDHQFSSTGITVGGGYAFQYMTRADYKPGSTYSDDRYFLLGDLQPNQSMHSVLVSAGFSTVEWFKAKKFVYPFQVNLAYTHPLVGRNVTTNDLVAGELVLFF